MHAVFLAVFFFLCVGITVVDSGRWSKWHDLTICSAKPCKCKGYSRRCELGKKVMIRSCIYAKDDVSVCQYKREVGIKLDVKCRNKRVCPGWSDWMPKEKCNCDTTKQGFIRLCNNPSPIHPDVLCWDDRGRDGAKEQFKVRNCDCTEEERKAWMATTTVRTTTTTGEPTTPLPRCCEQGNDYDYDYGEVTIDLDDYLDSLNNQITTTTSKPETTRKLSQLDQDYYDYYGDLIEQLPPTDCTPCTLEYGLLEEERKAWMATTTVRTTTTTGEPTTPLPWCCEQEYDYDYDNGENDFDIYDYLDDNLNQRTTTTSKPEPTRKLSQLDQDDYDYYDELFQQLPTTDCTPCTLEYGYVDTTESSTTESGTL